MSHPKMAVFWALVDGPKSGYAIEEFVKNRRARGFSNVGMSSIYKACKDLERAGHIKGRRVRARRGPGKSLFVITEAGRAAYSALIIAAVEGDGPGPSSRLAGAMFSSPLPAGERRLAIRRALKAVDVGIQALEVDGENVIAAFRRACLVAERKALKKLLQKR